MIAGDRIIHVNHDVLANRAFPIGIPTIAAEVFVAGREVAVAAKFPG